MNVAIKKLWAEHLRSDWYTQNFIVDDQGGIPLRTLDDKWSPFGVLCNIHAQMFPDVALEEFDATTYMDYEYLIPERVAVWAGLKKVGQFYNTSIPIKGFAIMDDYFGDIINYRSIEDMFMDGIPFFMIADAIETYL